MIAQKQLIHQREFYEINALDEYADKNLELINGEIVEKMPSFGYSSTFGVQIGALLKHYLWQNPIAHVTDAQGGYDIDDLNTFAPDIGVVLKSRLAAIPRDRFIPVIPDIVFEVVSASDLEKPADRIERKLAVYQVARVPLIVYVYPERLECEVYEPDQPMRVLGMDDTLDCGAVLPGFTLEVKDVFAE
jgi:Uma2 family endonuclease